MKVNFPSYDSFLYVTVHTVIERRNGQIYKTSFKGYAKADRPKLPDEVYSSLSTSLTKQSVIELEILE